MERRGEKEDQEKRRGDEDSGKKEEKTGGEKRRKENMLASEHVLEAAKDISTPFMGMISRLTVFCSKRRWKQEEKGRDDMGRGDGKRRR